MIEGMISKRAAAADAASTAKLESAATTVAKPAEPKKIDVGTVAAMGVAFGAIGAFLTALVGHLVGVFAMPTPAIIGFIIGIIALISGPSMLLAFMKLRKRNLGPILDANGWAVNAKARINVPFGTSLTDIATFPPGSQRDTFDRFAEKKSPWPKIIVVLLIADAAFKWINGGLDRHLPKGLKHDTYFESDTWFGKHPSVNAVKNPTAAEATAATNAVPKP